MCTHSLNWTADYRKGPTFWLHESFLMNVTLCNLTYLMLAWERSTYDNIMLLQEIKEKEVFYDARMKALRGLKATN